MRHLLSLIENRNAFKINNMLVIFLMFALTFVAGCFPERKFQDNRFTSSYPKVSINLGEDFQYLGTDTYSSKGFDSSQTVFHYGQITHEFYFLIPVKTEKRTIKKGVLIMFSTIQPGWHYYGQLRDIANRQDVFDYGIKSIGGHEYEYISAYNQRLDKYIVNWLNQKGYILPRCLLTRVFYRMSASNLTERIVYIEDATASDFECAKWGDKLKLIDEQKKYIDTFAVRADKVLQFNNP
jgi:hypothetical protein